MAKKPTSELSPAYAKRLARAEAQGKTRQQARGHRAGEHIVRAKGGARALSPTERYDAERLAKAVKGKRGAARAAASAESERLARNRRKRRETHERQKAREKWNGTLTTKDKAYARKIGRAWHVKLGLSVEEAGRRGVERMERLGPVVFRGAVKRNRAAYRQYVKQVDDGEYESLGEGLLDLWAQEEDEPNTLWYYYHSYS